MTKCDFCPMCTPSGKCYWNYQSIREADCKKAIKLMIEALKNINKEKRDD